MARDELGLKLSGADDAAAAHYARALRQLQCFAGDPVGSIEVALSQAPDFVLGHVFKGYLYGLSTDAAAAPVAASCHAAAAALPATPREKAHVAALGHLAAGRWHEAGRLLLELSGEAPLDALALIAGHQIDFFTGNSRLLRDRVAAALPVWREDMPGYHSVLAMHAFGLEEMGDYSLAESLGRRAVELEPRDGWAQHAVAHVMEMQSRQRDGIAWMRGNEHAWTGDSFLQIHNWWHLALFHYELGETDAVLGLFDGPIYGSRSTLPLNMLDASAILWRLQLGGVDVGARWQPLAANWAPKAKAGNYAFNDMHAAMAFVGAGMAGEARALLEAQREAISRDDDNAGFTRDVGLPVVSAIVAFGEGRYADAAKLLAPVRAIAHRFGGSHAQRDVIDLTLIEATLRAGDHAGASRLAAERQSARPASPLSALFARRAQALQPTPAADR